MEQRIQKLSLPNYTHREEIFNTLSHEIGVYLSIAGFYFILVKAFTFTSSARALVGSLIYGVSMICLFVCSSLYHSLEVGNKKKLLRILDHSTVYIAVAGTYTPYILTVIYSAEPQPATDLLLILWSFVALGIMLNFLDMERLKHILYGGCIALAIGMMVKIVIYSCFFTKECIKLSIVGGIFISIGVIMYSIGSKYRWFHSVFHIFVLISCGLFYATILLYLI